jgi:hypothetical protein
MAIGRLRSLQEALLRELEVVSKETLPHILDILDPLVFRHHQLQHQYQRLLNPPRENPSYAKMKMYVRSKEKNGVKGRPIGLVIAVLDGDLIRYGWSLCHANDKFDPKVAEQIALQRACDSEEVVREDSLPHRIEEPLNILATRAMKRWSK